MLLPIWLKASHLIIWVIRVWIEVKFGCLMLRINFGRVFEWFQDLSSGLTMLILVRIRSLYIHTVFLRLELLQELAVVLLLVIGL